MPRAKTRKEHRLGKQPPRYYFFLNPYQDVRFTSCPKCGGKTKLRKLPLIIHVDPSNFISLNKTCRFCPYCDLLIAHRDELENYLVAIFEERDPDAIGNDYLVVGTVDRPVWRQGSKGTLTSQDLLENLHDFKDYWQFKLSPRWGPAEPSK
jgi:hypothetical protein